MYDAPSEPSDNDNVIPTTTSSYIQLVCYPRSGKTAIQVFHNTGAIDSEDSEMCGSEAIHLRHIAIGLSIRTPGMFVTVWFIMP